MIGSGEREGAFMWEPRRLHNGNLLVPYCVTATNGTRVDGFREITPEDAEYETWLAKVTEEAAEHQARTRASGGAWWRRYLPRFDWNAEPVETERGWNSRS
jgi:hypothetical protein